MKITWFGHSCFLIENSMGTKILTDPFDTTVGYKLYTDTADIVTVSHQHFDHNYTKDIKGNPLIIDTCGTFTKNNISIKGISSYHDTTHGSQRGENIIFVIKIDNFTICHLGDLGHKLTEEDISCIGHIDILLIPVGGIYTIDGIVAASICTEINPSIIIPMHFKTPLLSFDLDSVNKFLNNMGNVETLSTYTLTLDSPIHKNCMVKILSAPSNK